MITSERLNRLSACVQAANSLIYPMHWQHIFIPLLPNSARDYLSAPMPFLVGVPAPILAQVNRGELGEVVLLNLDDQKLTTPFDDVSTLPSDVLHNLRKALKQSSSTLGDGLCRAFMKALVQLIGSYHDALRLKPGEKIVFDPVLFVSSVRGTSKQLFLERILQLQIFQQFIETRLDQLNRELSIVDEFELELKDTNPDSRFRSQYREWTAAMKKEGGAFLKAVNPKVKSAISRSRQAVRKMQQIISNGSSGSGSNGTCNDSSSNRSNSAPTSPKSLPKMKKSISGTAISLTSRTVTYVKSPPVSLMAQHSTSSSKLKNNITFSNNHSRPSDRINGNSNLLGIAPAASAESSDVEDLSSRSCSPSKPSRSDMNICEELENILKNKVSDKVIPSKEKCLPRPQVVTRRSKPPQCSFSNKQTPLFPPLPPPRSDKVKSVISNSNFYTDKCLIELDSPPKETLTNGFHYGQPMPPSNSALVFDPLYESCYGSVSSNTPASTVNGSDFANSLFNWNNHSDSALIPSNNIGLTNGGGGTSSIETSSNVLAFLNSPGLPPINNNSTSFPNYASYQSTKPDHLSSNSNHFNNNTAMLIANFNTLTTNGNKSGQPQSSKLPPASNTTTRPVANGKSFSTWTEFD